MRYLVAFTVRTATEQRRPFVAFPVVALRRTARNNGKLYASGRQKVGDCLLLLGQFLSHLLNPQPFVVRRVECRPLKTDGVFISAHEPCVNSSASHSPFLYSPPPGRPAWPAPVSTWRALFRPITPAACTASRPSLRQPPYFADPAATDFSYLKNLAGFLLVLT
ncbi:hypothetical protein vBPaeSS2019XI_055 [Pseudomonas phage vB_Pae-SS2019XI]|uniref:Uncharacterized protein n=1 Tax=Pseudomonas phage vB_Pae-SS2019XI TaxID=2660688 RepID=A0A6G6XGM7_9CAUD|nr:hypothetical protein JT355_gp55 [Pseudomonas phage vB_Pae-SS2019XI]QIG56933.1 hypothetical protein vBPaeSS2019XI_055 [Pseudomonas phage vB_Pae-SS2019XI]